MPFASRSARAAAGFTLVELLVIVSIMAVLGSIAFGLYYESAEGAKEDLARVQMAELAKAVRQFRQDTGYYPRQGPFALDVDPGGTANTYGGIAGSTWTADQRAFFYSPANLDQLINRPPIAVTHPQAFLVAVPWDVNTRRGWRGPYLQRGSSGILFADVGASLLWDGSGDPTQGTALIDMPALGDVRERVAVQPGSWARCATVPSASDCLLDFRMLASIDPNFDAAVHRFEMHGRPFLLVVDHNPTGAVQPRLIGFGHDGVYGINPKTGINDDVVIWLEQ